MFNWLKSDKPQPAVSAAPVVPIVLVQQVEQEAQAIEHAPRVVLGAAAQRCHFCGQLTASGTDIYGPAHSDQVSQVRFKGNCCGG